MNKEEHYNEGMELFARDKLDDAIAAYQRALQEDPNYVDALHALAMTYAHQEKLDEAIQVAQEVRSMETARDVNNFLREQTRRVLPEVID